MPRPLAVLLLVLAAACEGRQAPPADSTQASAPSAAMQPTAAVTIASPADGDTTGPDVTVVMHAEGVTIAKASGTREEGVGHFHLFLDTAPGSDTVAIPPTTSNIVHIGTGDSTYTFKGLAPGAHEIIAVIGFGNHVPMPSRQDTVHIVVKR
jgi:Domain of unknown function (DUF4399)